MSSNIPDLDEEEKEYKYTIRIHGKRGGLYWTRSDTISSEIVRKAIAHYYQMREDESEITEKEKK